jgi:asparagine synthase (glutamine-hydrolysing)
MGFNAPFGGFFSAIISPDKNPETLNRLKNSGADTFSVETDGVIMAAFKQFSGQGLWRSNQCAVSYDVEFSNERHLRGLVDDDAADPADIGEVIWQLYQKFGGDFLDKLRGAFGFAIWDHPRQKMMVVTDFYGLRQVMYIENGGHFAAASRIKHLLWAGFETGGIHPDAVFHYLFFQAICTPLTIFRNIRKLEPGAGFNVNKNRCDRFVYYDIQYHPDESRTESDWKEEIFHQVERTVDVYAKALPVDKTGCFLSGGTDSSSVAGFFTKLTGKPANTFSIGFDDPKYNEMDFADAAVKRFGTNQHAYFVTPDDVLALIGNLSDVYDEPFGNASVIPAYYCTRLAAQTGMEYLLGGDGGDEIFGGNERYVTNLVFQKYLHVPEPLRQLVIEPLLAIMPSKGMFHKAQRYVRRANIQNPERFYSYNLLAETDPSTIFRDDFLENLNPDSFMDIARHHYANAAPAHDTDRLMYLDMKFTITDNDIRKVTQMVEAAGIRVRYPLLDRDLVDFAATIPPALKVRWKKNRYIFKQAMRGFLPDEIITKSKHGMGLPVTPWFKQDKQMNALLHDTVFNGAAALQRYIKPEFIQKMKTAFETDSSTYYGDNLWVFLMLELWFKQPVH